MKQGTNHNQKSVVPLRTHEESGLPDDLVAVRCLLPATPMDLPQRVTLLSERPLHSVWPPPPASPEAPEPGPNFLVPRQIRPWFSSRLARSACASAAVG